jgi:hypothetical protein
MDVQDTPRNQLESIIKAINNYLHFDMKIIAANEVLPMTHFNAEGFLKSQSSEVITMAETLLIMAVMTKPFDFI